MYNYIKFKGKESILWYCVIKIKPTYGMNGSGAKTLKLLQVIS